MSSVNENIHDIVDLLDSEYYSIGITSGHEALGNLLEDFFDGRLDDFLEEQGSSKHEFHKLIFYVLARSLLWKARCGNHSKITTLRKRRSSC